MSRRRHRFAAILAGLLCALPGRSACARDGAHDFDFLLGDWTAHARQLPDRLNGSHDWIAFEGTEHHSRILRSNTNLEEFEVYNADKRIRLHAQTLRLYNAQTGQWSMYLTDVYSGTLDGNPLVGGFDGSRGEFFRQTQYKGRTILMRYVWFNISPKAARMEQSYSDDGGKSWELNWVCELSR
ncbi:MAG: hypothetical protein JSR25_09935 [Proteobacteria bacterium]|nr:hypothetical protein [Pseudomonadota bacterium]